MNGIELHGRYVRNLFFSGPGAGPDVTAATLLDDCIESVHTTSTVAVDVDAANHIAERERHVFLRPSGACVPDRRPSAPSERQPFASAPLAGRIPSVTAPVTPWLLRVAFPGIVPTPTLLTDTCARHGLSVEHVTDAIHNAGYVLVAAAEKRAVDAAVDTLERQHRTACAAYRRIAE